MNESENLLQQTFQKPMKVQNEENTLEGRNYFKTNL